MEKKIVFGVTALANVLGIGRTKVYEYIKLDMPCNEKDGKKIFDLEKVYAWLLEEGD